MGGRGEPWLGLADGVGDPNLRWIQSEITWKRKHPNCIREFSLIVIRSRFLTQFITDSTRCFPKQLPLIDGELFSEGNYESLEAFCGLCGSF